MDAQERERLQRGIATYQAQQKYLLDWLDELGSATDLDFDIEFCKYGAAPKFEWLMTGDSFILGSMAHGFSQ